MTVAWIDCQVPQAIELGTHTLFIGEITAAQVNDDGARVASMSDTRKIRRRQTPLTRQLAGSWRNIRAKRPRAGWASLARRTSRRSAASAMSSC